MAAHAGDTPERARRVERRFETPMLVVAVLVIPVVVLEASGVSQGWKTLGTTLNWLIWIAFAIELAMMLAVTPSRSAWLRSHPLEVAIVVLTPPFLPASLGALRLFRLARLLRVVVVVGRARRLVTVEGVKLASVIAGVAALGGGAILAEVEPGHHSVWDGVWWAMTTMSTVGYGDLAPRTLIGRLDALALMLIGVGFFALVTGAVAERFLAAGIEDVEAAEVQLGDDVVVARAAIVAELRDLSRRLQQLERRIDTLS